jgi:dihydrofolate reductase
LALPERNKNMHVTLIAAQTVDGYIARSEFDRSFDWTSAEDKQFYISKLKETDAVIMSSKTFKTFTRYPKGAHFVIITRTPESFENPRPDLITVTPTSDDPATVIAWLKEQGVQKVLVAGGASIYRQYLAAQVVNTVFLTVEPILFGKGVPLLDKACTTSLALQEVHKLSSQTIVLEYSAST